MVSEVLKAQTQYVSIIWYTMKIDKCIYIYHLFVNCFISFSLLQSSLQQPTTGLYLQDWPDHLLRPMERGKNIQDLWNITLIPPKLNSLFKFYRVTGKVHLQTVLTSWITNFSVKRVFKQIKIKLWCSYNCYN